MSVKERGLCLRRVVGRNETNLIEVCDKLNRVSALFIGRNHSIYRAEIIHDPADTGVRYLRQSRRHGNVGRSKRLWSFVRFRPAYKSSVHIRDNRFKAATVASPGFVANCIPEFRDAFLTRPPGVRVEPVTQKVECFAAFGEINNLRLVRMQGQSFLGSKSPPLEERGGIHCTPPSSPPFSKGGDFEHRWY